jgi:hypothetical protein
MRFAAAHGAAGDGEIHRYKQRVIPELFVSVVSPSPHGRPQPATAKHSSSLRSRRALRERLLLRHVH